MGTVIQSATYKLNNVCNAGSLPRGRFWGLSSDTDVHNNQLQLEYTTRYADSQDIFSISCAFLCVTMQKSEIFGPPCRNGNGMRLFIRCKALFSDAPPHLEKSTACSGSHTGVGDSVRFAHLRRKCCIAAAWKHAVWMEERRKWSRNRRKFKYSAWQSIWFRL